MAAEDFSDHVYLTDHCFYLHTLVRCKKVQKDLQVCDAARLLSELHEELKHELQRFTCVMTAQHVRNIRQAHRRHVIDRSPVVPSCGASRQFRSRSRLMSSRRARYGPL